MDRKKDGEQEPGRFSASKENIRSSFIFINKTSRRVRSGGDAENRESAAAGKLVRGDKGMGIEKKRDRCGRKQRTGHRFQAGRFATISE